MQATIGEGLIACWPTKAKGPAGSTIPRGLVDGRARRPGVSQAATAESSSTFALEFEPSELLDALEALVGSAESAPSDSAAFVDESCAFAPRSSSVGAPGILPDAL